MASAAFLSGTAFADAQRHGPGMVSMVRLVDFSDSGKRIGIVTTEKVIKSDEGWKRQLTPEQFAVTRKKGTEPAFTGKYYKRLFAVWCGLREGNGGDAGGT